MSAELRERGDHQYSQIFVPCWLETATNTMPSAPKASHENCVGTVTMGRGEWLARQPENDRRDIDGPGRMQLLNLKRAATISNYCSASSCGAEGSVAL